MEVADLGHFPSSAWRVAVSAVRSIDCISILEVFTWVG